MDGAGDAPGRNGCVEFNGYYTNLLNDGLEGHQVDGMSNSPDEEQSPNLQGNKGRTKKFEKNEDVLLVDSWLNISMDPVQGNNQKRTTYWNRIHAYFHENKDFSSSRNANSLMHRWSVIQEHVNKFVGCIAQLEARKQSGTTIEQRLVEAKTLFESQEKKEFKFLHCWSILRNHPKWLQQQASKEKSSQKKKKVVEDATPGDSTSKHVDDEEAAGNEDGVPKRPPGKKRAKEALRKGGDRAYSDALASFWAKKQEYEAEKERKKEERYKEAFALEQDRIALKKKQVEFNITNKEDKIMSMDLTALTYDQQIYFSNRQKEIAARSMPQVER
ncbi:DNA binding [Striga hermonthica]|uniref:DNA binding n=1 Tax=Striga hermonthica TaxID=68872 RepID=A0A9N7R3A0_STRHE|nr:DNA binding [Striga hermonthica]